MKTMRLDWYAATAAWPEWSSFADVRRQKAGTEDRYSRPKNNIIANKYVCRLRLLQFYKCLFLVFLLGFLQFGLFLFLFCKK